MQISTAEQYAQKRLSEEERTAELVAMVRALRAFYASNQLPAVFPELGDRIKYGDYTDPSSLGHRLLAAVTGEVNQCAHIKSETNPNA